MRNLEVKKIEICDLKDVAALEENVYPEEMCLGYMDYVTDFEACAENFSLGAYNGSKMVGYIVAYAYTAGGEVYVSDLVCVNPKALLPLLNGFREICKGRTVYAEFRAQSHRLIQKLEKKFPEAVSIQSDILMENYYGDEDAYRMSIELSREECAV